MTTTLRLARPLVVALLLVGSACAQTDRGVSATVPQSENPTMPAPTANPESSTINDPAMADGLSVRCDAAQAQAWVGKPASDENVAAARDAAGATTTRVISPGQPVTMDYRGDRLNVEIDDARVILKFSCG